jgi:hypothetical protein
MSTLKSIIQIFLAIVVSILILFSGVSISLENHICQSDNNAFELQSHTSCCSISDQQAVEIPSESHSCCSSNDNYSENDLDCNQLSHCESDCCDITQTFIQFTKTEPVIPQKTNSTSVLYLYNLGIEPMLQYWSCLKSELIPNQYSPPKLTFSFSILYRVFRI